MEPNLLAHLFCCFALTGLIWTVQLVHYPAFAFVDHARFPAFPLFHANRITWIVAPLMLVELVSGAMLFFRPGGALFALNFAGVALTWLSTFVLSVPCHNRLARGVTPEAVRRLVATNWPRTILWSLRSLLLLSPVAAGGAR